METLKFIGLEYIQKDRNIIFYLWKLRIIFSFWQFPKNSLFFYYFSLDISFWKADFYSTIVNISLKDGEFCFITKKGIDKRVKERLEFVELCKNKK